MWMENKPQCDWSNWNYANVSLETIMGSETRGVGPSWRLGLEEAQGAKVINISPVATAAASSVKLSKHPCGALCARHGWESWGAGWESGEHRGKCLEFRQLWGWWFCQRMDTHTEPHWLCGQENCKRNLVWYVGSVLCTLQMFLIWVELVTHTLNSSLDR